MDLKFKIGTTSQIENAEIEQGSFLVDKEKGQILIDTDEKNRIAISGGIGESVEDGGEIFNDYENNKANTLYSHAEGNNTLAGAKVFWASEGSVENKTYTLDSVEGIEVGDYYSYKCVPNEAAGITYNGTFDFCGTITTINGNTVTVSDFVKGQNNTFQSGYFWIPRKPTIGTIIPEVEQWQHTEGLNTTAIMGASHAEGSNTVASGRWSHAEGKSTIAGYSSHAEGRSTEAMGINSHAEGFHTLSAGSGAHAEGSYTVAKGDGAHAEGIGKISNIEDTFAGGMRPDESYGALANGAHVEGTETKATKINAHAEGISTTASGAASHAEGHGSIALGIASHAEGLYNNPKSTELNITDFRSNIYYESSDITIDSNNQLTYNLGAEFSIQHRFSVQVNLDSGSPYILTPNTEYVIKYHLYTNANNIPLNIRTLRGTQVAYSPNAPKEILSEGNYTLQASGRIYEITQRFRTPSQFDTDTTPEKRIKNRLLFRIIIRGSSPQSGVLVKLTDLTIEKPYLSTIGNGTSDSDRKNAMAVHQDGHAEIQTMGDTDNSVVIRSYAHNSFANALKGSKSGASILIDDVSPVTHDMSVQLSGYTLGDEYVTYAEGGGSYEDPLYFSYKPSIRIKTNGYPSVLYHQFYFRDGETSTLYSPAEAGVTGFSYGIYEFVGNSFTFSFYNDSEYTDLVYTETRELVNTSGVIGVAIERWEEIVHFTVETNCIPMTDFSSVTVSSYGKNLFDVSKIPNINGITNNGDGTLTLEASKYTFPTGIKLKDLCPELKAGDVIYLSGTTNGVPLISFDSYIWHFNSSITVSQNHLNGRLYIYGKTSSASDYDKPHTISNIQIALGTTATDYEPYIAPTEFTPTADGTVNGVTSLYPNTTLMTDTDGVLIDCEYNRDINKAFAELHAAIISLGGNV